MTRFLLTNDDGINAPGIQALARSLQALEGDHELHWAAPNEQYSGCGHRAISEEPIRVEARNHEPATTAHAVFSSPASCTRIGLRSFAPDTDWVISGVNAGGNMGVDQFVSGTVAGARQGVIDGKPAIALSQYIHGQPIHWPTVERWTTAVVKELMGRSLPKYHFWNVNYPHLDPDSPLPELVFCEPSKDTMHLEYRQNSARDYVAKSVYRDRPVTPGTDVGVCFSGKIAITQLSI
ncbi:MAG: 5'/3'-nucleotidase SurE [Cyanobacteria bacterium P01_F01_bin.153]